MEPLLILLSGLDGTECLLGPIVRAWGPDAVAVAYPAELPSDYAARLPLVIQSLPVDRDFILLGWSFSGPLALMAAAAMPARLKGVVLCATFVEKPLPLVPQFARRLTIPALYRLPGSRPLATRILSSTRAKEAHALIELALDAVPTSEVAARVRQVLSVNAADELMSCPVPILDLRALTDRVVPRLNAERIKRMRPDVEIRTTPGPHFAFATQAAEAPAEIHRFAVTCATGATS